MVPCLLEPRTLHSSTVWCHWLQQSRLVANLPPVGAQSDPRCWFLHRAIGDLSGPRHSGTCHSALDHLFHLEDRGKRARGRRLAALVAGAPALCWGWFHASLNLTVIGRTLCALADQPSYKTRRHDPQVLTHAGEEVPGTVSQGRGGGDRTGRRVFSGCGICAVGRTPAICLAPSTARL